MIGVGARLPRAEDGRLLTGDARFIADLTRADALHLRLVRSPVAHGRIIDVCVPELPPETFCFSAPELGAPRIRALYRPHGRVMPEWPLLAVGKVRYAGEPIVAVLAPDPYAAEDVAAEIEVDIEELDPAVDPCDPSAPVIHDGYPGNVMFDTSVACGTDSSPPDCLTVKRVFRSHRHTGVPMETRGCMAEIEDGVLVVWSATQIPELLRFFLSDVLGREPERIHVRVPDIGGGFGVKGHAYPEDALVAMLALRTGRPVRWIEDRVENFLGSIHARDEIFSFALTIQPDGTIVALEADVTIDAGAYPAWPQTSALEAQMTVAILPGPYRIPRIRAHARSVCTNKAPFGTYRGVARPGVTFALERLVDEAARELGIDPVVLRMNNLVSEFPHDTGTGLVYDAGSYRQSLAVAAKAVSGEPRVRLGENSPGGLLRGVGFACFVEQSAHVPPWARRENGVVAAPDRVSVGLNDTGTVSVAAGITSHGQGQETTLAQIAADRLGLTPDLVSVAYGTTERNLYSMGTLASRSAVIAGNACASAADTLADRLRCLAAAHLDCSPDSVWLADGRAVSGQNRVQLSRLAADHGEVSTEGRRVIECSAEYDGPAGGTFSNSCHAAVVDVDPATGSVRLSRYLVVEDCGRVINPLIVEGQIQGGVAQGIGSALYEELCYDQSGQLLTTTFMDYRLPSTMEVPRVEIVHLETPSSNALGTKGMGESGAIGPMAAIANAIADALGTSCDITETPLTPSRVWHIIQKARSS